MEIQFTNINNLWVAEFEVRADFNIHLERDAECRFDIWQKTAGGKYELINETGYLGRRTVYDKDFTALVYPKTIKIVSAVNPTLAVVTPASGNDDDITVSNGIIEYHFDIPMSEGEGQIPGSVILTGTLYDDYSELYDSIQAFVKENYSFNDGDYYELGVHGSGIPLENPRITINEQNVVAISITDGYDGINLHTDVPFDGITDGTAVLCKNYILFDTPKV